LEHAHQDFQTLDQIRRAILDRCGGEKALAAALPTLIADAVDFVVDPVRTARTLISDLDNVEKTFIGLKIEHFLRDFLDFPKGIRDLRIGDMDVDVKTTVRKTWMIPPETFRNAEPCLLILTATEERYCSMGLIVAREEYLNRPNRDGKRSVKSSAFADILWLVEREPLPESRWTAIDMARFRDLRKIRGGSKRAAAFFRENLGKVIHRSIVQGLLFDQDDYMKRIRKNGGAKDILGPESIAILSGAYRRDPINALGLARCGRDEFVSFAFSPDQRKLLFDAGYFDKKSKPARSKV
jgi:hypothetical protein